MGSDELQVCTCGKLGAYSGSTAGIRYEFATIPFARYPFSHLGYEAMYKFKFNMFAALVREHSHPG